MNKNGFHSLGNVLKKVLNDIRSSLDRYTHLDHCSRIVKLPEKQLQYHVFIIVAGASLVGGCSPPSQHFEIYLIGTNFVSRKLKSL